MLENIQMSKNEIDNTLSQTLESNQQKSHINAVSSYFVNELKPIYSQCDEIMKDLSNPFKNIDNLSKEEILNIMLNN